MPTKPLTKSKPPSPLFEIRRDGITVMHTSSESCIPNTSDLKAMKKLGYTFLREGKRFTP